MPNFLVVVVKDSGKHKDPQTKKWVADVPEQTPIRLCNWIADRLRQNNLYGSIAVHILPTAKETADKLIAALESVPDVHLPLSRRDAITSAIMSVLIPPAHTQGRK
jgi:hypothetical protein